ncbi:Hypothetical predicted protein [Pelobates cultripes]|uniref:Uncharacterized protein n=1 Tax=Pelobates cultripes TaxID=61616 RepID=A0AAD1R8D2_PELCU|nr:Hypothetical predicted protein [Pelobates cultripes]
MLTALIQAPVPQGCKAILTDSFPAVMDGAQIPLRKRATSRAKSARLRKRAKAQRDSSEFEFSDIKKESNESIMDASDYQSKPDSDSVGGEEMASSYSMFPAMVSGNH